MKCGDFLSFNIFFIFSLTSAAAGAVIVRYVFAIVVCMKEQLAVCANIYVLQICVLETSLVYGTLL